MEEINGIRKWPRSYIHVKVLRQKFFPVILTRMIIDNLCTIVQIESNIT